MVEECEVKIVKIMKKEMRLAAKKNLPRLLFGPGEISSAFLGCQLKSSFGGVANFVRGEWFRQVVDRP